MMTKKHFERIAEEIKDLSESQDNGSGEKFGVDMVAFRLAILFQEMNPLFSRAKFLRACGQGDVTD